MLHASRDDAAGACSCRAACAPSAPLTRNARAGSPWTLGRCAPHAARLGVAGPDRAAWVLTSAHVMLPPPLLRSSSTRVRTSASATTRDGLPKLSSDDPSLPHLAALFAPQSILLFLRARVVVRACTARAALAFALPSPQSVSSWQSLDSFLRVRPQRTSLGTELNAHVRRAHACGGLGQLAALLPHWRPLYCTGRAER